MSNIWHIHQLKCSANLFSMKPIGNPPPPSRKNVYGVMVWYTSTRIIHVQIPRFVRQNFAAVFNCIVPHQCMSYAYILFEIPESQLSHFVSRFSVFGEYKGAQRRTLALVWNCTSKNHRKSWDKMRRASGPVLTDAQGVILYTSIYHGRLPACQPSLYATRLGIYPYKMLRRFWNFQHLFCFRVYTV